ncbi:MAG: hypothetical protein AAB787_02895 [Patescibacteria group bacterium]
MNRSEHVAWCKSRALDYVYAGDLSSAFKSLVSDLGKHSGTADHAAIGLGTALLAGGHLATRERMQKFIEDVN